MDDGAPPTHDNPATASDSNQLITRRRLISGTAAVLGLSGSGAYLLHEATEPAMALTGASTVVNSATISTDDGTITDVALDETNAGSGIEFNWEGFESDPPNITINMYAKLGSDVGSDGDGDDAYEQIATGDPSLSGTSGSVTLGWNTLFGSTTISLPSNHSGIETSDFTAGTDGNTINRTIWVKIEAVDNNANADTVFTEASNTADVTNINANMSVGGETDINLTG